MPGHRQTDPCHTAETRRSALDRLSRQGRGPVPARRAGHRHAGRCSGSCDAASHLRGGPARVGGHRAAVQRPRHSAGYGPRPREGSSREAAATVEADPGRASRLAGGPANPYRRASVPQLARLRHESAWLRSSSGAARRNRAAANAVDGRQTGIAARPEALVRDAYAGSHRRHPEGVVVAGPREYPEHRSPSPGRPRRKARDPGREACRPASSRARSATQPTACSPSWRTHKSA